MADGDREKWRSIGFLGGGRTRARVDEGRAHPESGRPFKAVTDEQGHTVTEHSAAGAAPGVSDRQDVHLRPKAIQADVELKQ